MRGRRGAHPPGTPPFIVCTTTIEPPLLWVRLDDLAPGDHSLTFGGEYEPGGFWVEATYQLRVS